MIKKCLLVVIAIFLILSQGFSQRLSHSFGLTISAIKGDIKSGIYTSAFTMSQTNFVYFPRFNLVEMDNSSISFGMPVGFGVGIITEYYFSNVNMTFAYDIPAVLDFNFGANSTAANKNNIGGYGGIGFGYYQAIITKNSISDFNGSTYGPLFRAGFRFSSSKDNWKGQGVSAGMFYKIGIDKNKLRTIGFNLLYDL